MPSEFSLEFGSAMLMVQPLASYGQQMSVTSVSDLSWICLQVSAICGFDLSYPLSNTLAESRLAVCGKAALLGTRHAACGDEAYGAAWWIGFSCCQL
jgi:hypothetical protein